jgi:hypothetical protein
MSVQDLIPDLSSSCYPLSLLTALNSRLIVSKNNTSLSASLPNGVPRVRLGANMTKSTAGSGCTCGARSTNYGNTGNNRLSRFRTKMGTVSGIQVDELVSVHVDTGGLEDELSPRTATTRFALHSMTIQEDSKMEKGGSDWDSEDGEKQRI